MRCFFLLEEERICEEEKGAFEEELRGRLPVRVIGRE